MAIKKYLVLAAGVLAFAAGSALADSTSRCDDDGIRYYKQIRGKRGRKYLRHFLLQQNLKNDKKRVYDEYGWTPHRLRTDFAGKKTERWRYYSDGLEFTFDCDGNLIEERRIPRDPNVNAFGNWAHIE